MSGNWRETRPAMTGRRWSLRFSKSGIVWSKSAGRVRAKEDVGPAVTWLRVGGKDAAIKQEQRLSGDICSAESIKLKWGRDRQEGECVASCDLRTGANDGASIMYLTWTSMHPLLQSLFIERESCKVDKEEAKLVCCTLLRPFCKTDSPTIPGSQHLHWSSLNLVFSVIKDNKWNLARIKILFMMFYYF